MLPGVFLESGVLEWFERVKFEQVKGREVEDFVKEGKGGGRYLS